MDKVQEAIKNLDINELSKVKELLSIQEDLVIKKALTSDNLEEIQKANSFIKTSSNVSSGYKSILVDPNNLSQSFGYKNKPFQLSYDVLRSMSKVHIIKSIIETRKDQIASFANAVPDKYSTGFEIRKKRRIFDKVGQKKLKKEEQYKIEYLTDFMLSCGNNDSIWHGDTFDVFLRKIVDDSLSMDQTTFEIVRKRNFTPVEFFATDGATYRIADTYSENNFVNKNNMNGVYPSYVQVWDGQVLNDFYPWELCFGVRNPSTNVLTNGYGRSELEDLIQTITSLLNADTYNSNYFKVGSNPGGIFRYSGNISPSSLDDFRKQWMAQASGVMNFHKIPMINADKIDYIQTHQSNRDMEYDKYQSFLIKICCAVFKIDPSEIGFESGGNGGNRPLFEGNNESRLKYSKDKGLKPLLKQIEFWINKYIINYLDKDYEFVFVGLGEEEEHVELESDVKRLQSFETLNEVRMRRNLPPLEGGDSPLNSIFLQSKMQAIQMEQQAQMLAQQAQMSGGIQQPLQANPAVPNQQQPPNPNSDLGQQNVYDAYEKSNSDEINPFIKDLLKDFSYAT